ncbi:Uncharacterised protein [Streptococcus pneumoniae]|nr:Uncharacterised protein [Streptococcus pneumoniae]CIW17402.1 Uncharacterised protein [Streptococcus pneumoniae]
MFDDVLNSWKSCCDTVIVSDYAIFQWYVEVNTNEDFFTFQVNVFNSKFCHVTKTPLFILFETIISHFGNIRKDFTRFFDI